MSYPEQFYYLESMGKPHYTKTATTRFNMNRMLQNKAAWITRSSPEKKQKKLVLTDWRARNWTTKKQQAMVEWIEELLKQGFSIYAWQSDTLAPLTTANFKELLSEADFYSEIEPTSIDEVASKALEQYKIPREQIHLLDPYWVDFLVEPQKPRLINSIYASDWIKLNNKEQSKLALLPHSISTVILDENDNQERALQSLSTYCKKPIIKTQLRRATLDLSSTSCVSENIATNLAAYRQVEELKLVGELNDEAEFLQNLLNLTENLNVLNFNKVINLKEHDILSLQKLPPLQMVLNLPSLSENGLEHLLRLNPHFKHLTLRALRKKARNPVLNTQLLMLDTLHIKKSTIPFEYLQTILKSAEKLTVLKLTDCTDLNIMSATNTPMLQKLELLIIDNCNISVENLVSLLQAVPNLKQLYLYGSDNTPIKFPILSANSLSQLEKIHFEKSQMTPEQLASLLKSAPNLRKMTLKFENNFPILPANSLNQMEEMLLQYCNFTEEQLASCIKSAPNLKQLTIKKGTHFPLLPPNCLNQLEEITFEECDISPEQLASWLKSAPNLKRITILRCEKLSVPFVTPFNKMPLLEKITTTEWGCVTALLKVSPNLQSLIIDDCDLEKSQNNRMFFNFPPSSLDNLQYLKLSTCTLPPNLLETLIYAAPNIQNLELTNSKLSDDFNLAPQCLKQLKSLNCQNTKMNDKIVSSWVNAAPNINNLNFLGCGELELKSSQAPYHLPLLKVAQFTLSKNGTNLEHLLKAAPNLNNVNLACPKIVDLSQFNQSLQQYQQVTALDLSGCMVNAFTAIELEQLLKLFPNLKSLILTESEFRNGTMNLAKNSLPHLVRLDMDCTSITEANLLTLLNAAPLLNKEIMRDYAKKHAYTGDDLDEPITRSPTAKESLSIDADTTLNPNKTYDIQEIFYPINSGGIIPPLKHYRRHVYQGIKISTDVCDLDSPFNLEKQGDLQLIAPPRLTTGANRPSIALAEHQLYGGLQNLVITPDWQPLPSLSSQEVLLHYQVKPETSVEIKYSKRDNLYYIRHLKPGRLNISVEMTLSVPNDAPVVYPEGVEALIQKYLKFGTDKLDLPANKPLTGTDYVAAIIAQKRGACRHRCVAFKHEMQLQFPDIPVRTIVNDFHAYVELFLNNKWCRCDLGGYPVKLNVKKISTTASKFTANTFKNLQNKESHPLQNALMTALCTLLKETNRNEKVSELTSMYRPEYALSYAQSHIPPAQWNALFPSSSWSTGGFSPAWITQNAKSLDTIYKLMMKYHDLPKKYYFLGDKLQSFLSTLNKPCSVENPWISYTIQPGIIAGTWHIWGSFGHEYEVVTHQQLLPALLHKLGPLISVDLKDADVAQANPYITDFSTFLEEGGLLSLKNSTNRVKILQEISKIKPLICTKKSFSGLFLKGDTSKPAWLSGMLSQETANLTYGILLSFVTMHPDDYEGPLKESLSDLSERSKNRFIESFKYYLRQAKVEANQKDAHQKLYNLFRKQDYEHYFKPAEKEPKKATEEGWKVYCQRLINPEASIKKHLIEVSSDDALKGLRFGIEAVARSTSRPIFYINHPDDLICNAPFISRVGNKGVFKKGPGGRLFDFLQMNQDKAPILVVNYSNFRAEQIVQCNELLDKVRRVQGVDLPVNTLILGLMNVKKEDCYQGSDFTSRFNKVEPCTIESSELQKAITNPSIVAKVPHTAINIPVINLFNSPDWKEMLLGQWVLNGNSPTYEAGLFPINSNIVAIPNTIEIQNGPIYNAEFVCFWQEAMLRGEIVHEGVTYKLPADFKIVTQNGYDWQRLRPHVSLTNQIYAQEQILNPGCLSSFFPHYQFNETHKKLVASKGLIEDAKLKGGILNVYFTQDIAEDEWARLLSECQKHSVKLNLRLAPGTLFPAYLVPQSAYAAVLPITISPIKAVLGPKLPWPTVTLSSTTVIESNDVDVTVKQLTLVKNKTFHVIDVSECQPEDLLQSLQGRFNNDTLSFDFTQRSGILTEPSQTPKNIILKGKFSAELADKLAAVLLARGKNPNIKDHWILISDNTDCLSYLPQTHKHVVTTAEKAALLQLNPQQNSSLLEKESFSQIQARQHFLKAKLGTDSNDAWKGMHKILPVQTSWGPLGANTAQEAAAFTLNRYNSIVSLLKVHPYVFLTGLSGVGKSTFVKKILAKQCHLHIGEQAKLAWATDIRAGAKILFFDEYNLSGSQGSEFEGLFQNPPSILINGQLHKLTSDHKVVFAGNPTNYGDERQLPALFQRHGGAIQFEPLPPANLYEDVLKPLFAGVKKPELMLATCSHFLSVYAFFVGLNSKDILISPRELEMMALLTVSYCHRNPNVNMLAVAQYYAYQITKHLVPSAMQGAFDQKFKGPSPNVPAQTTQENFLVTPSRQDAYLQLNDYLNLRQWRQSNLLLSDAQKYGGLGGLIFEGEPGMGKSELVIHTLLKHGFKEVHSGLPLPEKPFYKMPVNLSNAEKEELLRKAFDEGAVVLIDEINSAPMMEQLLNDLLMGFTPEGKRPKKPGFMVIGTQNPGTMAGRRLPSTALLRRMNVHVLKDYAKEEMVDILKAKAVPPLEIDPLVSVFIKSRNEAKNNFKAKVPSFRDLLGVAEKVSEQRKDKTAVVPPSSNVISIQGGKRTSESSARVDDPISMNKRLKTDPTTKSTVDNEFTFFELGARQDASQKENARIELPLGNAMIR